MSKIVFINPPLSHEERYGVKAKAGGWTPPLGLAYLAAVVRSKGFEVSILDAAALEMSLEGAAKKALLDNPKYIGITAATVAIYNAKSVADWIKKLNNSVVIIIGGAHFTALPIDTMEKFNSFDIGVFGEGENTIVELLETLESNGDLSKIRGIVYRKAEKTFQTEKRPFIENLDELPTPAWDLLPDISKFYTPPAHTVKKFPAALLVLSRGCPGRCRFCDRSVFGNVCRAHSAKYAVKIIKELNKTYGINEFQIRDDNFLAYKTRLVEFCNLLKEEQLKIVWSCAGRVDMISPETLKLMKDAGCWQIWYGVESGSQEILDFAKKNISLEETKRTIKWTKEAGISPGGFFILGLPGETEDTIKRTIKFMLELDLDEFHSGFFVPFPGTDFYEMAENYGKFNNDWQKMNGWIPIFIPDDLTKEQLEYYSKRAFQKFYFRRRIVLNYLKRTASIKHIKTYSEAFLCLLEFLTKKRAQ